MIFRSNDTATTEIYTASNTLSLHDALPICETPPPQPVEAPVGPGERVPASSSSLELAATPAASPNTRASPSLSPVPEGAPAGAKEPPANPMPFTSAMVDATGSHPLLTTCKKTWRDGSLVAQTIDYVLFARGAARTTAYLPCPIADPAELAPLYLPAPGRWGSDHLSVFAEVELSAAPHGGAPASL